MVKLNQRNRGNAYTVVLIMLITIIDLKDINTWNATRTHGTVIIKYVWSWIMAFWHPDVVDRDDEAVVLHR